MDKHFKDMMIIAVICTILVIGISINLEFGKLHSEIENYNIKIENLENNIGKYKDEIFFLELEIENLESEIDKLNRSVGESSGISRGTPRRVLLGTFEATAYCKCTKCSGIWSGSPTASGTIPKEGRTIAVDPKIIPLGSKVSVDGKVYIAEDTGSAIKGNIIDIYYEKHEDALQFGRQKVEIWIIK